MFQLYRLPLSPLMVLTNVNGDLIILSPASRNAPPSDDQASTTSPSTAVSQSSPVLALLSPTPTRGTHTEYGLLTRRLSAMLDGTPTSNIWWETLESCRTPVLSSNRSEGDDQVIIILFLSFWPRWCHSCHWSRFDSHLLSFWEFANERKWTLSNLILATVFRQEL